MMDRKKTDVLAAAFVALAFIVMLVPLVGMVWMRTDSTTENRELAEAPSLQQGDGTLNVDVMAQWGAYFEDHFALRNQLVAANAAVYAALGSSPTDQVVVGSDGWLYYGGTLPDYLGQGQLSERALANIAHNLKIAQGFVESRGAAFAFAVAPNKNSLYPEHMPYYYHRWEGAGNLERLLPHLESQGVNYVDLKALLLNTPGVWYMKTDSHWDNRGALLAANALVEALGHEPLPVDGETGVAREDFKGDLELMLMPAAPRCEENWYYEGYNDIREADDQNRVAGSLWSYDEGVEHDVTADWTQTTSRDDGAVSEGNRESLLVYRDSFGNALLPYLAAAYDVAAFSKLVPYDLSAVSRVDASAVIVERAERHLSYLAQNPPIVANPSVKLGKPLPEVKDERGLNTTLELREYGSYWEIAGVLDDRLCAEDVKVYVAFELQDGSVSVHNAFWMSVADDAGDITDDYGYKAYVSKASHDLSGATVRVYVSEGDEIVLASELQGADSE